METRRAGLGANSLVLATDCSGNGFAFRDLPEIPPRLDDAPVWLFDHEEDSVAIEAASFDEWLRRFLSL